MFGTLLYLENNELNANKIVSFLPLILTIIVNGDKVEFKLYSNLMNAFKLSYCLS